MVVGGGKRLMHTLIHTHITLCSMIYPAFHTCKVRQIFLIVQFFARNLWNKFCLFLKMTFVHTPPHRTPYRQRLSSEKANFKLKGGESPQSPALKLFILYTPAASTSHNNRLLSIEPPRTVPLSRRYLQYWYKPSLRVQLPSGCSLQLCYHETGTLQFGRFVHDTNSE